MKEQDYEHENQNNHQDQFESKEKDSIKLQKEISRLRDHLKDLDDQLVEEYHKNEELNNQLNRSVNHLDCQSAIENLQQALFQLQNSNFLISFISILFSHFHTVYKILISFNFIFSIILNFFFFFSLDTDNEINLQLGKYKMNLQNSLNDIKNLTTEINIQKSEIEKLTIENNSIKKKNFELQSQLITSNDFIDKRLIINLLISLFGRDQSKAGSGREILKILASLLQLSDNEKHQVTRFFSLLLKLFLFISIFFSFLIH